MRHEFGGGILEPKKFWDLFPFTYSQEDREENEETFRSPFTLFGKFLDSTIINQRGEIINSTGEKKTALKKAYKEKGSLNKIS